MEDPSLIIPDFLQLDTKGACFLCLQPLTGYLPSNCANGVASSDARVVSLRSLCDYLQINVRSTLLPVLREENCPPECDDLTVVLCGACAQVTEAMTQLFGQLEELQMRVDYQVQELHGILEEGEEEEWEGVKEKMMAGAATMVERLRREALRKCAAMLQRRIPVMRMERQTQTEGHAAKIERQTQTEGHAAKMERQTQTDGHVMEKEESPPPISPEKPPTSPFDTLSRPTHKVVKQANGQIGFQCVLCSRTHGHLNRKYHLLSTHPHVFFEGVQQSTLSPDLFPTYCLVALDLVTRQGKRGFQCGLCRASRSDRAQLYSHLILQHYPQMTERVMEAQKKPLSQLDQQLKEHRDREPPAPPVTLVNNHPMNRIFKRHYKFVQLPQGGKRLQCRVCQVTVFPYHSNARRHLVNHHLAVLFQSVKQPDVSNQQFEEWCRHALRRETRARTANEWRCPVCQLSFSRPHSLRCHFVTKHYIRLKERVVHLQQQQKDVSTSVVVTGPSFSEADSTVDTICRQHTTIIQTFPLRFQCLECQRPILSRISKGHVMNAHPQLFFQDLRPESVTEEQFATFCVDALELESRRGRLEGRRYFYKCGICGHALQTSGRSQLSYHLITEHYSQMRQRIIKVQQQGQHWEGVKTYGSQLKNMVNGNLEVAKPSVTEEPESEAQKVERHKDDMKKAPWN